MERLKSFVSSSKPDKRVDNNLCDRYQGFSDSLREPLLSRGELVEATSLVQMPEERKTEAATETEKMNKLEATGQVPYDECKKLVAGREASLLGKQTCVNILASLMYISPKMSDRAPIAFFQPEFKEFKQLLNDVEEYSKENHSISSKDIVAVNDQTPFISYN